MRPQDIVILLKIICLGKNNWYSKDLASQLFLSPAEVSNALVRTSQSGLLDATKKHVRKQALLDFLIHGLPFLFFLIPRSITRGVPTALSHPIFNGKIISDQNYVWPDADADSKGYAIEPLYPGVVKAVKLDNKLYQMLALIDVLRMGKAREKKIAIDELKKLFNESSD